MLLILDQLEESGQQLLDAVRPSTLWLTPDVLGLRRAMWCLPLVNGLSNRYPRAALKVVGEGAVAQILREHAGRRGVPRSAGGERLEVRFDDSATTPELTAEPSGAVLRVPPADTGDVALDGLEQLTRLTRRIGLLPGAPRLSVSRPLRRRMAAGPRGPRVWVATPGPLWREVLEELSQRIGARPIVSLSARPVERLAQLSHCAVVLGGGSEWSEVAAALGVPVIDPLGEVAAFPGVVRGPERDVAALVDLSERAAATRWPSDRLGRLLG